MKSNEFKTFKTMVKSASEHDPIWWAGYYWVNMTDKQATEMVKLLEIHPNISRTDENTYMLPSGLTLTYRGKN